jgi:hypothetical protein
MMSQVGDDECRRSMMSTIDWSRVDPMTSPYLNWSLDQMTIAQCTSATCQNNYFGLPDENCYACRCLQVGIDPSYKKEMFKVCAYCPSWFQKLVDHRRLILRIDHASMVADKSAILAQNDELHREVSGDSSMPHGVILPLRNPAVLELPAPSSSSNAGQQIEKAAAPTTPPTTTREWSPGSASKVVDATRLVFAAPEPHFDVKDAHPVPVQVAIALLPAPMPVQAVALVPAVGGYEEVRLWQLPRA